MNRYAFILGGLLLAGPAAQAQQFVLFDATFTFTKDDADNSKPDPDIVHAALRRIGLPADQVILLGDTPYDVEAAGRAGVKVVALRCGGWSDADLAGAIAVYDSPEDLLAHFEESPFARRKSH